MKHSRFIYFAGVDGSGKSTVIDKLIKEYNAQGIPVQSVWLRFNYMFTRPILLLCRILGLTRRERRGDKVISVHDFHRSRTIALLVQYLHLFDTTLAFIFKVWFPLKFSDKIIFSDKFVYDILADFMVETKDMNLLDKAIAGLFLKLIPKNTPVLFFYVDKEEILKRKPEVLMDDEDYNLKYEAYTVIMRECSLIKIQNNTIEDTVRKVKEILKI